MTNGSAPSAMYALRTRNILVATTKIKSDKDKWEHYRHKYSFNKAHYLPNRKWVTYKNRKVYMWDLTNSFGSLLMVGKRLALNYKGGAFKIFKTEFIRLQNFVCSFSTLPSKMSVLPLTTYVTWSWEADQKNLITLCIFFEQYPYAIVVYKSARRL